MAQFFLHREIDSMLKHNRDGSFATIAARERILIQAANQLYELGFKNLSAKNLKFKHVTALILKWKTDGLSSGTIKNRVAHFRWWAEKIGKRNMIPQDNRELGIANRSYVNNDINKAKELTENQMNHIRSERMKLSLELARQFGLRREEALKFQPSYADQEDKLVLKASWCKGGRAREIPIRAEAQRELLKQCHAIAGKGSMIPKDRSYKDHLKAFENACHRAGISNVHGLRHAYAQTRYLELTSWNCPKVVGGVSRKAMTVEQKAKDSEARMKISAELGHGREEVTAVYLGS